jgi:hypothetical protein
VFGTLEELAGGFPAAILSYPGTHRQPQFRLTHGADQAEWSRESGTELGKALVGERRSRIGDYQGTIALPQLLASSVTAAALDALLKLREYLIPSRYAPGFLKLIQSTELGYQD